MKPKTLKDIWDVEVYYDEMRWSPDKPAEFLDLTDLQRIQADLTETNEALNSWLRRLLLPHNYLRIKRINRKLNDFRRSFGSGDREAGA